MCSITEITADEYSKQKLLLAGHSNVLLRVDNHGVALMCYMCKWQLQKRDDSVAKLTIIMVELSYCDVFMT